MFGMGLGISSGGSWYQLMFIGFGIIMVFPIRFLTEISEWTTGWEIGWRQVIWLELILIGLIVVAMMLLKQTYPELHWFEPIGGICLAALMRGILWFVEQL